MFWSCHVDSHQLSWLRWPTSTMMILHFQSWYIYFPLALAYPLIPDLWTILFFFILPFLSLFLFDLLRHVPGSRFRFPWTFSCRWKDIDRFHAYQGIADVLIRACGNCFNRILITLVDSYILKLFWNLWRHSLDWVFRKQIKRPITLCTTDPQWN